MTAIYAFGQYRLDVAAGILFQGAEPVALGQRAVALLQILVEGAGNLEKPPHDPQRGGADVGSKYVDEVVAAPYRHARLSAMKLAGDPNNPAGFKGDATADPYVVLSLRHFRYGGAMPARPARAGAAGAGRRW